MAVKETRSTSRSTSTRTSPSPSSFRPSKSLRTRERPPWSQSWRQK
jgi:hypothetical protein